MECWVTYSRVGGSEHAVWSPVWLSVASIGWLEMDALPWLDAKPGFGLGELVVYFI